MWCPRGSRWRRQLVSCHYCHRGQRAWSWKKKKKVSPCGTDITGQNPIAGLKMSLTRGTHPSLGMRRSVLNWKVDSTGCIVHVELPSQRSWDLSSVFVYLGNSGRRQHQSTRWDEREHDSWSTNRVTHLYLDSMCVSVYVTFGDSTVKLSISITFGRDSQRASRNSRLVG